MSFASPKSCSVADAHQLMSISYHAHPRAARHGIAWYEIDINWWGIRTLQLLGLAKDIKLIKPSETLIEGDTSVSALSEAA